MNWTIGRVIRWVVTAIDAAAIVVALYWLLWPAHVLTVVGQDAILNSGQMVVAGQAVIYRVAYCKYTDKQAFLSRSLVGSVLYGLPQSTNNIPPGCRTAISQNTIIPTGVAPGIYHLELRATYQINPLRSVSVESRTQDFIVTSAPITTTSDATSSSVSPAGASVAQSTVSPPSTAPTVSQAVKSSNPTPTPNPSSAQQPGLLRTVLNAITSVLGI